MRERIRKRLKEYRAEALQTIGIAVIRTRSQLSSKSRTNSHAWYQAINKENEAGFAKYMDQSAKFIRQVAPCSSVEYVDELYDGGQKLKREIMAKTDHVAASGNSVAVQLRTELEAVPDKLIERRPRPFPSSSPMRRPIRERSTWAPPAPEARRIFSASCSR